MKLKPVTPLSEKTAKEMLKKAVDGLQHTYPHPNNGYCVTVLTSKGNMYTGASYGSDTWTLTMHSESVALAHAANHGESEIIAITGPNCHICKQLIYENALRSGKDILIIIEDDKKIKQIPISKLMPYPWPEEPQI